MKFPSGRKNPHGTAKPRSMLKRVVDLEKQGHFDFNSNGSYPPAQFFVLYKPRAIFYFNL